MDGWLHFNMACILLLMLLRISLCICNFFSASCAQHQEQDNAETSFQPQHDNAESWLQYILRKGLPMPACTDKQFSISHCPAMAHWNADEFLQELASIQKLAKLRPGSNMEANLAKQLQSRLESQKGWTAEQLCKMMESVQACFAYWG